jgi:hypothetical protein
MAVVGFPAVSLLWLEAATARQRAVEQEQHALEARNDAQAERNRAELQSADLLFTRGLEFSQQGEVAKGLHRMLEGLRTAPADAADFRRVVRTNLAAWSQQICSLRHLIEHSDEINAVALSPDSKTVATGASATRSTAGTRPRANRSARRSQRPDRFCA